jgi:hypothetical protein
MNAKSLQFASCWLCFLCGLLSLAHVLFAFPAAIFFGAWLGVTLAEINHRKVVSQLESENLKQRCEIRALQDELL